MASESGAPTSASPRVIAVFVASPEEARPERELAENTIRDLNRELDWTLPDDEANTVAGLVIYESQVIPTVGQVFSFHGFRFEVLARENNRITKLKIMPL